MGQVKRSTSKTATTTSRDQLLEAASALMRETDALDISLVEIAQRAGINAALVKYYFGNKEGLIMALLRRDMRDANAQLGSLIAMKISPTAKMRIHLAGVIKMFFRIPYLNRLIHATARTAEESKMAEMCDQLLLPAVSAQAMILKEGVDAGEFRSVDPKLFYFATVGACDALYASRFTLRSIFAVEHVDVDLQRRNTEFLVDFLMRGILRDPVFETSR